MTKLKTIRVVAAINDEKDESSPPNGHKGI